jgi:hypothetical protein
MACAEKAGHSLNIKRYVQLSEFGYCLHNGSKGDIDDSNQHTYGRGGASPHADKSNLRSPLWSIIDLHISQPRRPESWPFLLLTQAKDRKR